MAPTGRLTIGTRRRSASRAAVRVGAVQAVGAPVVGAGRVAAVVAAHDDLDLGQQARQRPNGRRLGGALLATDQHAAEARVDGVQEQRPLHPLLADQRGEREDRPPGGASRDGHQNSIPRCALIPCWSGCFTSLISVTRSAASISSGGAPRPVSTRWSRAGLSRISAEDVVERDQPGLDRARGSRPARPCRTRRPGRPRAPARRPERRPPRAPPSGCGSRAAARS